MKKLICVLIALFILLVTTGCQKKETVQESKTAEASVSSKEPESAQPAEIPKEVQPSTEKADIEFEPGIVEIDGVHVGVNIRNGEINYEKHDDNSFDVVAIPDYETAIRVASQIWESIKKTRNIAYIEGTVPTFATYYTESGVWRIGCTQPIDYSADKLFIGPEFNMVLRASDGAVLKVWFTLD